MTSEETRSRVLREVTMTGGQLTSELGKALHLSESTVRGYLYDLVVEGLVRRVQDPSIRSPRGFGADRWYEQEPPLGPPGTSQRLLCNPCAGETFGDYLRYRASLSPAASERLAQEVEDYWVVMDTIDASPDSHSVEEPPTPLCERCGNPRW